MTDRDELAGACAAGELFSFDSVTRNRPRRLLIYQCPTDPSVEPRVIVEMPDDAARAVELLTG